MTRVNPLYLLGLMLFLLIFVFVKLEDAKVEQLSVKENFEKTNTLALNIVSLKKSWSIGKKNKVKLEKILRASALRDSGIVKKYKRDSVSLSAEAMDYKTSQYLLNKLLNDSFVINTMKIRRLDDLSVSLKMEIAL